VAKANSLGALPPSSWIALSAKDKTARKADMPVRAVAFGGLRSWPLPPWQVDGRHSNAFMEKSQALCRRHADVLKRAVICTACIGA